MCIRDRFHNEDCDLCGNSAFREGYKEQLPVSKAFEPAPSYPGYLQPQSGGIDCANQEELVQMITEKVMAAMAGRN